MKYRELILMLIGKSHILTMCESCGCLIGDKEIHSSYHADRAHHESMARVAFNGMYDQGGGRY